MESVEYSPLNLPYMIDLGDSCYVRQIYSADGTLLRRTQSEDVLVVSSGSSLTPGLQPLVKKRKTVHTEYRGPLVYEEEETLAGVLIPNRGSKLVRVNTPHGFVSGDTAYYYITDQRGSVRQVINGTTGDVTRQYHYYPFGGHFGESTAEALIGKNKEAAHRFGGKELRKCASLSFLDFPARPYDYSLLQFWTDDPMREKYYGFGPRLFCGADPVNNCDPTGMDIAVLIQNIKDTIGHMALLIQNEDGKWEYFSINGDDKSGTGRRKTDDLYIGEWNSVQKFLDSPYNVREEDNGDAKTKESINNYGYKEAYAIETTKEQDDKIRDKFVKISKNEDYIFFLNNCATTVQRSLSEGGLNIESEFTKLGIATSPLLGGTSEIRTNRHILPDKAFKSIEKLNPGGKHFYKKDK